MKKKAIIGFGVIAVISLSYAVIIRFNIPLPPGHIVSELPASYAKKAKEKGTDYLITNVSIVPMNRDTVMKNQNVLIRDGIITQIQRVSVNLDTTFQVTKIDGNGLYLIPGLNDMHVHINDENSLLLFIANGVTTIRNMWGFDFHLTLKDQINKKEIIGPSMYTAGSILEGSSPAWTSSTVITTKAEAREAVVKCKQQGFDFVKVYHTLPKNLYKEILRAADSIAIPVVGHIPFDLKLEETLALTQYSLEHIDIRPIDTKLPLETREKMIGISGKWICPTLIVFRNLQRDPDDTSFHKNYAKYVDHRTRQYWNSHYWKGESDYDLQKKMAKEIFRNGGRFVAGTDCLNPYVVAGFSLHEELQEMVNAGLSEFEALQSATIRPAEMLRRDKDIGTIEPGKIADLLLLDGNPLKDIRNTTKIKGVMVKGRLFNAQELKDMLMAVERTHLKINQSQQR